MLWYTEVIFDDKKSAADFENGLSTVVTLWKRHTEAGFNLGHVDYLGHFSAAFSAKEILELKAREMWPLSTHTCCDTPQQTNGFSE